jgi:fused signal recognition particle receptor
MISLFGRQKETQEESPKSGFFDRMKQAVSRTRESLSSKIEGIVALTRTVDESSLEDLEAALLTSDLGVQTTTAFSTPSATAPAARPSKAAKSCATSSSRSCAPFSKPRIRHRALPQPAPKGPSVTFLVGVNGTGKTTSAGKLAAWYRAQTNRAPLRRRHLSRRGHRAA